MIVIYTLEDLNESSKDKNIRDIKYSDFKLVGKTPQLADVVIYVDMNQELVRVMFHRYQSSHDKNAIYSIKDLNHILIDGMPKIKNLGKSLLRPGTKKRR